MNTEMDMAGPEAMLDWCTHKEMLIIILYEEENHLYILQTPLFRVRNKKETIYCYSDEERQHAINKLTGKPEITRFKGLGEISPDEFQHFIGDDIRLDPVMLDKEMSIEQMLEFYMGKNTPDRQKFIIENLKVELDYVEE